MDFTFLTPNEMIIRQGAAAEIGKICGKYAKRICIFRYGKHFDESGIAEKIGDSLKREGLDFVTFHSISSEPSPEVINEAAAFMQKNNCDGALAVGGGSVIDAAKAACALAPNGSDIMEYVEGFSPKKFEVQPLPLVAMPTTAGTGSECTKNSVITQKGQFKNSVRDDHMLPVAAVIDAELMLDVPRQVTMTAGVDCLCQLVECYVSRLSNPMCDALTLYFAKTGYTALKQAFDDGHNIAARESMALCASVSGIGISNAGLGATHGLAAGLGALTPLSHGFICGVAQPHVIRFNIAKGVTKYADITRAITGKSYQDDEAAAYELAAITEELNAYMGLPKDFRQSGIEKEQIPAIAKASMGSSMKKNPVDMSLEECEALLRSMI
ncbi:iron-containing alcohol dehydrogenase [Christensenellaceae bacterium OttesenSCG-928-K19]|nr:iron-containing alcohol dehydrogenase [Christensenellaceae bacterium OttesenSCG-928-K19]